MKTTSNQILLAASLLVSAILLSRSPAFAGGGAGGGGRGGGGQAGPDTVAAVPVVNPLAAPTGPSKAPDPDGFLQRWIILEPIPTSGQVTENASRALIATEYFPNQLTVLPHDGDKETVQGATYLWHAVDTLRYNVSLYHFGNDIGKPTANVIFWIVTIVNCPEDMPNVRLAIGSNSSSIWWVNGKEAAAVYGDILTVVDDAVSKRLTLHKGQNVIRAAVLNNGGNTDFCARILDETGNPIKNLTVTLP